MERRLWIVLVLWGATAAALVLLGEKPIAGMLVGPAVMLTAWLYGFRGAVVASCIELPTHLVFASLGGAELDPGDFGSGILPGHGFTALFAFCIGWTRSLRERLERETEAHLVSERARMQAEHESLMHRADRLATVGTMAAGVAHEINNPLTYMLGALEVLRDRVERQGSEEVCWASLSEELDDLEDGTARIERIVRELELFIGGQARPFEPLELGSVAETAVRLSRHELGARAELECSFATVPQLCGEASRLGQVFVAVLINAMQAIPTGEAGRIVFDIRYEHEQIVASVSDNGVGMSEEQRARAFDPFFSAKTRGTGAGLGLPVCASIMREHGGSIELDSELGVGTTIWLRFPPAAKAP